MDTWRLSQGNYESVYYAEEMYSSMSTDKQIRISDRGAIVNFMLGLNAYTISSGIFPKYLHGDAIVARELVVEDWLVIGYLQPANQELSKLANIYVSELRKYGAGYIV